MQMKSELDVSARKAARWFGLHGGPSFAVVLLATGAFAFIEVASEVQEGELEGLDHLLLASMRDPADLSDPQGPPWFEEMVRDFTALGGTGLLLIVTLASIGYLLLLGRTAKGLYVAASIVAATLMSGLLKDVFSRPRPALVTHLSHTTTFSFPSGHAMLSAAVYLTLGTLLASNEPRLAVKGYILMWSLLLTLLVGLSRVYVGVHWPTDVAAGWAAGAAWAGLSSLIESVLPVLRKARTTPAP